MLVIYLQVILLFNYQYKVQWDIWKYFSCPNRFLVARWRLKLLLANCLNLILLADAFIVLNPFLWCLSNCINLATVYLILSSFNRMPTVKNNSCQCLHKLSHFNCFFLYKGAIWTITLHWKQLLSLLNWATWTVIYMCYKILFTAKGIFLQLNFHCDS